MYFLIILHLKYITRPNLNKTKYDVKFVVIFINNFLWFSAIKPSQVLNFWKYLENIGRTELPETQKKNVLFVIYF